MNIQKRTWEIVEVAKTGDYISRVFDVFILSLIFLNIIAVISVSVDSIEIRYGRLLYYFEVFSVIVFTIEYIARVWSCTIEKKYSNPVKGRLRFMVKPLPIIDLIAILPFYLPFFIGIDMRFIRIFRLLRILRVAKIGRYSSSLHLMQRVIKSKKEELILTIALMLFLLITSSCLLYHFENPAQPKAFPDIPSTMWWSVVTLTTVG